MKKFLARLDLYLFFDRCWKHPTENRYRGCFKCHLEDKKKYEAKRVAQDKRTEKLESLLK